ncbi:ATP-binding cassette domain-containing protein [Weissella confusa]|uniref:ATP-binding cassette domain-containing protein n=1 Tax=Weissella confusa TaxID=1583 RepID=A0A923SMI5_WEICO|nr:ATP-binding cassette domain-containing protein [Weissella confusa]
MDLESITSLNDGLINFKGGIIFTSHDHTFAQTIADHIIVVSDQGAIDRAETTYDEFMAHPEVQKQDYLRDFASKEESDNTFLRGLLGRMLFKGEDAEKTLDVLSGGEKVRVMLSKLMLTKPNVLVLDDPTNISFTVRPNEKALVMAENDVAATALLDIIAGNDTPDSGEVTWGVTTSHDYLAKDMNVNFPKPEMPILFSANASKSKQATSRKKQLEKITLDDIQPSTRKYPYINFEIQREIGNDMLRVENLSKTVDGVKLLDKIVVSHDRHFLNAVSTMILDVDFGKIKLFVGNYDFWKESSELAQRLQSQANAKKEEQIKELQDFIARQSLGIAEDQHYTMMADLPEVTKVKVLLAQALFGNPDILILDEPTNGLDTKTIAWLEDFLADYQNIVFAFDEFTVLDTVMQGHKELYDVKNQMDEIYTHDPFTDEDGIKVGELSARFEELNGWSAETEAAQLLSVSFTGKKLYDDVNLKFTPGNTYGVIGANGAGKSTFLKVLEGKLQPTTGTVSMEANERMSSLVQDHFHRDYRSSNLFCFTIQTKLNIRRQRGDLLPFFKTNSQKCSQFRYNKQ